MILLPKESSEIQAYTNHEIYSLLTDKVYMTPEATATRIMIEKVLVKGGPSFRMPHLVFASWTWPTHYKTIHVLPWDAILTENAKARLKGEHILVLPAGTP